jgi:demethylmenaquinone methyltransferase/2-methoxy-6-polyprenyl-1,4-benzoquinol methylase
MFDRLAPRYDLFNHLTSMGLATLWRRDTLKPVRPGMRVLDLGCGTGDLALGACKRMGDSGDVLGLDFSPQMLAYAAKRSKKLKSCVKPRFICRKAEDLPFEDKLYDLAVSGFVLRNLYENIDRILDGVFASLRAGGEISFMDITEAKQPWVGALWRFHMNTVGVFSGKLVFGKDYPTLYLVESAKRFLNVDGFSQKLKDAGFEGVFTKSYMFGMVTLYRARKP